MKANSELIKLAYKLGHNLGIADLKKQAAENMSNVQMNTELIKLAFKLGYKQGSDEACGVSGSCDPKVKKKPGLFKRVFNYVAAAQNERDKAKIQFYDSLANGGKKKPETESKK